MPPSLADGCFFKRCDSFDSSGLMCKNETQTPGRIQERIGFMTEEAALHPITPVIEHKNGAYVLEGQRRGIQVRTDRVVLLNKEQAAFNKSLFYREMATVEFHLGIIGEGGKAGRLIFYLSGQPEPLHFPFPARMNESMHELYLHLMARMALFKDKAPPEAYPDLRYTNVNLLQKEMRHRYRDFVVIDFETTGLNFYYDRIVEIGAARVKDGVLGETYETLVNPLMPIPPGATRIHGITDEMVTAAPSVQDALPDFLQFIGQSVIAAHNAPFDMKFLITSAHQSGFSITNGVTDTLPLCKKIFPELSNHRLGTVAAHLKLAHETAHRSLSDVLATAGILTACLDILDKNT